MAQERVLLSERLYGSAREIEINGGIKTNGAGVAPIEQHGAIETFRSAVASLQPVAASIKSDYSARFALGIGYGCLPSKFVHWELIHDYDEEQGLRHRF